MATLGVRTEQKKCPAKSQGEAHLLPAIPPLGHKEVLWKMRPSLLLWDASQGIRYAGSAIDITFAGAGETRVFNSASFRN
ncbi:uncharacterized protein ARMOST_01704 [Armillaria ostoyae]|uniref:Uncharacterized protein n=1 Tax=Armillaria ostoyae TaxID=47428 RepID=A0A284QPP1_ARMOS|nr:uncharacterized protein ARMOST_01704 [Armillaria ostoyae]